MHTLKIKQILVPIDFSEASLQALDTAAAMAKRHTATLTLLHVIQDNFMAHGHFDILPVTSPQIEIIGDKTDMLLRQIAQSLAAEWGIEVRAETVPGFVASEICLSARRNAADIIVMSTHGASGFREFFMGTNAYAVVRQAPCPVLTVPPNRKWTSFSRILFPVRNTPGALHKYDFLRNIIRHNQATLLVLGLPGKHRAPVPDWLETQVRQLEKELRDDDVLWQLRMVEYSAHAAAQVLKIAEQENMTLIAVTANLDYGISDFFSGPYTQQIVHHARVPVLCIRPVQPAPAPEKQFQRARSRNNPDASGLQLQFLRHHLNP